MKMKFFTILGMMLVLMVGLTACLSTPNEPTVDLQGLVSTSVAQTLAAHSSNPTTNPLPTSQFPTATLLPSATPIATLKPLPTYQAPVPTQLPCLHMNFIKDVTIPDNTNMAPGTAFTKTWRLYNDGSCTWANTFVLYFFSGDQMGAPTTIALPSNVLSGGTVDISVNMVAPATVGTYTSNWKMKTPDGTIVGSGSGAPIYAKIVVTNVAFAVSSVNITVDNATPASNPCTTGHTFTFTAAVTVTAAGTVTLNWVFSDNSTMAIAPLTFTGPGTQSVNTTWTLTGPLTGSASIYIDSPNHQTFGPGGNFTYTCTP
jgi:hypothetical protein